MEKNQYQKKKEADGYVVVEAAVLLPLASIFIVLLIGLCSYLCLGCFLLNVPYIHFLYSLFSSDEIHC